MIINWLNKLDTTRETGIIDEIRQPEKEKDKKKKKKKKTTTKTTGI